MSKLRVPVSSADHIRGSRQAPVILVEYGDYECPACAAAHPRLERLLAALPREVSLVFRNFPLLQAHPHAFLGATAAEAAGLQGRFWEMHDAIFERQDLLTPEGVIMLARRVGLDLALFERDLDDETLRARIRDDFLGGARSGVSGTPGYFVNGEAYRGPIDVAVFKAILNGSAQGVPL